MRIIFVLPSSGGGGGAHSIVQESLGLKKLGINVAIASPRHLAGEFEARYPELKSSGISNPHYSNAEELAAALAGQNLAIATMALSVQTVVGAAKLVPASEGLKLGYYIQDYEPLFYAPGTPDWSKARQSFQLMHQALLFAKTDWLCSVIDKNHNLTVHRVQASIDHEIYFPRRREVGEPLRIAAMVRAKTPRRAPKRTIRVLEQIAANLPQAEVVHFGSDHFELAQLGLRPSEALINLGPLSRQRVAATLQSADLFLDLSDYQAFGRTGLEGMACGCVPVLPVFGGTDEYAEHGVNSYVVDTRSDEEVLAAVDQFVNGRAQRRREMRDAAIATASNYSIGKAAYSEYRLFRDFIGDDVK